MCLCSAVHHLAGRFDESEAKLLSSDLNKHLAAIRSILTKSKALARDVRYQVVPNNQRTMKILSIQSVDTLRVNQICDSLKDDVDGFWTGSADLVHTELRRRLVCVLIFLRSKLDAKDVVPPSIAPLVQGARISELRYAGRKYIKIARKLGNIGAMLWLPMDVPASTYERYLNMDDEEVFAHLQALHADAPNYTHYVQRLLSSQLISGTLPLLLFFLCRLNTASDPSLPVSFYNLVVEYSDVLQGSDQVLLLIHALGGSDVPVKLLDLVRVPKRRWTLEGEIENTSAADFGLPLDLVTLLSGGTYKTETIARPELTENALEDGTPTWSISPETTRLLSGILSPRTEEHLASIVLSLICFVSPPPLEGNTSWSVPMKKAVWALLDKAMERKRVPVALKTNVIEALLYFSERDSFPIRRQAIDRARALLNKSMAYYFHASITLFESILFRLDGSLAKSISKIEDFLAQSPHATTRLDNALRGRLHISLLETKIQHYDNDIPSVIYAWEGKHPLSTLEIEVTRRLQGAASRFFQSIGDFTTARASLEEHLWLNSAKPIRHNTRLLIVGRLAEIYCELHEYQKATDLLQPEFDSTPETEKKGRPYRRLLLASVEANIGQEKLDAAESTLGVLADIEPPALHDMNDQTLHMRRIIATARTVHEQLRYEDALRLWRAALQTMEQLEIFASKHPWTAALIYLSMAHAQLTLGDTDGGKQSWATAVDMSRSIRCEYVVPVVANTWLRKIVGAIHQLHGWPFRMMLPGGKPDVIWA
ncbi:hypothetical protein B0T10DRAFT_313383 [Thelonectria olida]|uniref:Uncharacterized protein n=1 Tax=Thelonectria olida TaxID=1576542 RepID=A0A9P8W9J7_9HYPO|nr:hypothetical protein B0T10DRAFT_313383 [Thelonectria olida]